MSGYDQVVDLLGPGFQVAHQSQGLAAGDPHFRGASIASRYPITRLVELDLHLTDRSRAADFPCTTLVAQVEAPEGAMLFVNHLPNWQLDYELEREQQAVAAAQRIEELMAGRIGHAVVAGDFDADPWAASIRF